MNRDNIKNNSCDNSGNDIKKSGYLNEKKDTTEKKDERVKDKIYKLQFNNTIWLTGC
jgi:hypothetical protein